MRLLDLYCGAGGASMGYHLAGFEVVGVDIKPQPNYPFEFHQADALDFSLNGFDVIHASPPCQAHTKAKHLQGNTHTDLIPQTRDKLKDNNCPYVIENVQGSPLINPIELHGYAFGLMVVRPRLFESNEVLCGVSPPPKVPHTKMGRPPRKGEYIHVVGHFSGVKQARKAMGIIWMGQTELKEAIPPAYTEFIGKQLIRNITNRLS